ncbi:RluA family pseudouridine synthase [Salinicoccus halodurans]|uniref:RNA pseudouridylate synthase n=1 Tax=Salinicoccus halodurans TaxID=407035 RepID=A0A0F7HM18_9STAP|nr:RluA family pseudouridine synthase [Salinicoccus halodurans]AKG74443.1 pseudouridine synthase [Salinicoccus halodurans]SFK96081.1 23S rRNA pseudouridine1911/1915/1917 synthase [Salinicoccus halodurans]
MKFTVNERFDSMSLEDILKALHVPKKEMHLLRMSKDIVINDEKKPLNSTVSSGDKVVLPDDHSPSNYKPSYRTCDILYEDRYLAVLFKPRGVKTHPNDMHETNTLMNHAIYTLETPYLEPVHRLDQETKGVLLVAKHPLVKKMLDHMLAEREIKRTYIARVDTKKLVEAQTVNLPIAKNPKERNKYHVTDKGKEAITHILSSKVHQDYCEIEIELETGRTHQIRVHLEHIGLPVIGDTLYGGATLRDLQLFSYRIEFVHPITQKDIIVELDRETL